MCSIIGCVGSLPIKKSILDGLIRLEYRGYDSAGVALIDQASHHIRSLKVVGGVKDLMIENQQQMFSDGYVGLGHTRWATHGKQTIENAHPHFDCFKNISIVHNGIIENFARLHDELAQKGHQFVSQTDSEVVAHLLEELLQDTTLSMENVLRQLVCQLEGMFALVILIAQSPEKLFFVRKGSPLCIGIGQDYVAIASDVLAFSADIDETVLVPDCSFGWITQRQECIFDFAGKKCLIEHSFLQCTQQKIDHNGYSHYMLKEIYEQPAAIMNTVNYMQLLENSALWKQISVQSEFVQHQSAVKLIACGGSWHAASIGQFFFETIARTQTSVYLASECRYMPFFYDPQAMYVFLSQSGETADTLEALRMINAYDAHTVGIANVSSSTLVRECKGSLITQAGPEIAVASTKAFSTQLVMLYWLAHRIAHVKGLITHQLVDRCYIDLMHTAVVLEQAINRYKDEIKQNYAPYYSQFKAMICLGKHISYPFAMEAALKMKEIPYIFAQSYPAGELKHGPLALVDNNTPVFVFSVLDLLIYKKLINSVHAAKSRGAHIVVFGFTGQKELQELADVWFEIEPVSPLLAPLAMVGLMQFLVYEIANYLGLPIDKPRNLAKSVTVE